jgi:hypothetical protein
MIVSVIRWGKPHPVINRGGLTNAAIDRITALHTNGANVIDVEMKARVSERFSSVFVLDGFEKKNAKVLTEPKVGRFDNIHFNEFETLRRR